MHFLKKGSSEISTATAAGSGKRRQRHSRVRLSWSALSLLAAVSCVSLNACAFLDAKDTLDRKLDVPGTVAELRQDPTGPLLAYVLSRFPDRLDELQGESLSPEQLALGEALLDRLEEGYLSREVAKTAEALIKEWTDQRYLTPVAAEAFRKALLFQEKVHNITGKDIRDFFEESRQTLRRTHLLKLPEGSPRTGNPLYFSSFDKKAEPGKVFYHLSLYLPLPPGAQGLEQAERLLTKALHRSNGWSPYSMERQERILMKGAPAGITFAGAFPVLRGPDLGGLAMEDHYYGKVHAKNWYFLFLPSDKFLRPADGVHNSVIAFSPLFDDSGWLCIDLMFLLSTERMNHAL